MGTGLEFIKFPTTLTTVGHEAFRDCHSLASIDFNGCSASLDYQAFSFCHALESVTIPATVALTGWGQFQHCNSLKSFTCYHTEIDGWCEALLSDCPSLETVTIYPANIWGSVCFAGCRSLKTVTFLDSKDILHYGNNFIRVPSDVLFIVPDGTAEEFLKKGYMNLSDKSGLPLVRAEFESEASRINDMAAAISGGNQSELTAAISSARSAVEATDDYMVAWGQIAAIKAAAKTFLTTATLASDTDVTAAAITNPDFERFDIGWKVPSGWWVQATGQISQTIANLPAGIYRLESNLTSTWRSDALDGNTNIALFAASSSSSDILTRDGGQEYLSVEFNNYMTKDVRIGMELNDYRYWQPLSNFRLYYIGEVNSLLANASSDHPVDLTTCIANSSFNDENADGWEGDTPQFQSFNDAEFYQRTFDLHQTINGLPNGNYVLKVKGFHRPGDSQVVYSDYQQGIDNASAELYVNDKAIILNNQASGAQATQLIDNDNDWRPVSYGDVTMYVPNSMYGTRIAFDAGLYENELPFTVTDGTITLGIRLNESVECGWVIFDDFRLEYLGTKVTDISKLDNAIYIEPVEGIRGGTIPLDAPSC